MITVDGNYFPKAAASQRSIMQNEKGLISLITVEKPNSCTDRLAFVVRKRFLGYPFPAVYSIYSMYYI